MLARRELAAGAPGGPGGDWRATDRKSEHGALAHANIQNLRPASWETQIAERRDFYRWFYEDPRARGGRRRGGRWPPRSSRRGAGEMAGRTARESMGRVAAASSNEVQGMMRQGNQVIFDDVFPSSGAVEQPAEGQAAVDWDMQILAEERT